MNTNSKIHLKNIQTVFDQQEWFDIGLSFQFIHGYVSFIATTPSLLSPREWLVVLFEEFSLSIGSEKGQSLQNNALLLFNTLRAEMANGKAVLPEEIVEVKLPLTGVDSAISQWNKGFSLAKEEFGHLWEMACKQVKSSISEKSPFEATQGQWIFFSMYSSEKRAENVHLLMERTDELTAFLAEVQKKYPAMWGYYVNWFHQFWKGLKLSERKPLQQVRG